MAFKLAIIFCAIATQTLGAPKPCHSNCAASGSTFSHEAMTGMSTHGTFMAQQNSAFQQLHQSLMNQLQEAHHLDYSQPGTWHKNAAFKTNDGGQVYQEHGKIETDNSQMRYFKKNYTNSWSTGIGQNSGAISNDLINTHGRLNGGGYSSGSSHHQEHHQNWEVNSNDQQAQKIEDLGVQHIQTTQVSQNVIRNFEEMSRNLQNYINQCTERVHMGQLSNYQSYTDVIQQHLDQMKQAIRDNGLWSRLIGDINSLETQLNELKVQAQHSANLVQTGAHQPVVAQRPVSISQNEEYQKHVSITSNSHSVPVQTISPQSQQYVPGTSGGYQQSTQYGSHGQTSYVNTNQDVASGASQHPDYTLHSDYGQDGRYTQHQSTQQGAGYSHGASQYTQGTTGYTQHNAGYKQHGGGYNQHAEQFHPVQTSPTKTVEENWNASGSRKETTYGSTHVLEPIHGRCRDSDGQYSTWCPSNNGQTENLNFGSQGSGCHGAAYGTLCRRYKREYKDDYSQQTEDLTQQTEDLTQQTEDLTQQTEDLTQQTEDLTQQTEDLSQHIGNLQVGNQRRDQGGYGQSGQGAHDYSQQQQQTGGIEFGSQYDQRQNRYENHGRVHGHEQHGHNDGDQGDYTQQTQGSDNFTQQHQHHGHEQHGHNDGDQGRHRHGVHGHEQHGHNDGDKRYTQQSQSVGGFSQQQTGNLEFGSQQQQDEHHGHVHGHEQHGHDDGDQGRHGHGVYGHEQHGHNDGDQGRHRHGVHGHEQHGHNDGDQGRHGHGVHGHEQHGHNDGDYRYNQQGSRFDYSQQQHEGGYTQQTENLSQQTQRFEDLTQQTQSAGDYTQQTEDLTQQTQGFEDLTQQHTTGGLQFGQQQVGNQRGNSGRYGGYGQRTEDLSQQTQGFDDLTQQHTTGGLQFGQRQVGNQRGNSARYGGYGQQTEDWSQQTQSFGDLTQQTTGSLGFEQQTGNLEFGHQQHDLSQQTQSFGDLTQSSGHLQLGNERPAPKPPARGQIRASENGNTAAQDTPLAPVKGGRRRPAQLNTYPQQSQNSEAPGVISLEDQLQQTNANQWHNSHQLSDLTNENYQQGRPLDGSQTPETSDNQQQNSTDTQLQFQPRILEAYGGKGPYSINHNDNIFVGVKPNPTATLAPISDSWDIRERPNEIVNRNINHPTFAEAPDRAPRHDWEDTTTTTTPAPGFWKRVGNKITTTYEKTKEKISSSLG